VAEQERKAPQRRESALSSGRAEETAAARRRSDNCLRIRVDPRPGKLQLYLIDLTGVNRQGIRSLDLGEYCELIAMFQLGVISGAVPYRRRAVRNEGPSRRCEAGRAVGKPGASSVGLAVYCLLILLLLPSLVFSQASGPSGPHLTLRTVLDIFSLTKAEARNGTR